MFIKTWNCRKVYTFLQGIEMLRLFSFRVIDSRCVGGERGEKGWQLQGLNALVPLRHVITDLTRAQARNKVASGWLRFRACATKGGQEGGQEGYN